MAVSFYFQNVNGLRTKTSEFFLSILNSSYDIVCINETNLTSEITDNELFTDSYNVYRKDRDLHLSTKQSGGGVLVAVTKKFESILHEDWSSDGIIENIWICITTNDLKKLYVCCAYAPPHTSLNNYLCFCNKLSEIIENHPNDIFIVLGDFNLFKITWKSQFSYLIASDFQDSISELFVDFMCILNLQQFNSYKNTSGNILDLILSNNFNISVNNCLTPLVHEDVHHPALDVLVSVDIQKFAKIKAFDKQNFFKADYSKINEAINSIEWNQLFETQSVDTCTELFYAKLYKIINTHVPMKKVKNNDFPFWFSRGLIAVIKEKNHFHQKWKKYKNLLDYVSFSDLRKRSKALIKSDYNTYIQKIETSMKNNVKPFWSFIKSKNNRATIPAIVKYNSKTAANPQDVSNIFSEYFSSVYEPDNNLVHTDILNDNSIVNEAITLDYISENSVRKEIESLNITKSTGSDKIPPVFIKNCINSLVSPLHIIFNKSLSQNVFPKIWKLSKVVPVFKAGPKNQVTNYRPISLLPIFSKMLESIITNFLFNKIKQKIIPQQHGFYRGRSVLTNMVPFVQYLQNKMDERNQVCAIYTDFSKAFDKVHHSTLLIKLGKFGIHGSLFRWVSSYITNRSQYVSINNCSSVITTVTSGVPQGSHLGPLLFSIFINDISKCFKNTEFSMYADDLKFFNVVDSQSDIQKLQTDIDNLWTYCTVNKLFLNIKKCKTILFTRNINKVIGDLFINGKKLEKVSEIRDLGIILDEKLNFSSHIDQIVQKSYKNLGFIFRSALDFKTPAVYIKLFRSLVLSHLEFATVIWNPFYDKYIERIEKIQIKFINRLNYKFHRNFYYKSYDFNLKFYNLQKLTLRREWLDISFLHKTFNNKIDASSYIYLFNFYYSTHNLRHPNIFYTSSIPNTNACNNSPVVRLSRSFNKIVKNHPYIDINCCSIHSLKQLLFNFTN